MAAKRSRSSMNVESGRCKQAAKRLRIRPKGVRQGVSACGDGPQVITAKTIILGELPDPLQDSELPPEVLVSKLKAAYDQGALDMPIQAIMPIDPSGAHALIFVNLSEKACTVQCGHFSMDPLGLMIEVPAGKGGTVVRHLETMIVGGEACELEPYGGERYALLLEGEKGELALGKIREGVLMLALEIVVDGKPCGILAHFCFLKQDLEATFSTLIPM